LSIFGIQAKNYSLGPLLYFPRSDVSFDRFELLFHLVIVSFHVFVPATDPVANNLSFHPEMEPPELLQKSY
jgi:hypothetical protein